MHTLLLLTVIGGILITVGLSGLYIQTSMRLYKIEKELKRSNSKIGENKREINILKNRDANKSDKLIITHEWNEAEGIRYPSQEV